MTLWQENSEDLKFVFWDITVHLAQLIGYKLNYVHYTQIIIYLISMHKRHVLIHHYC